MLPLSKQWTAKEFFNHVRSEVGDVNPVLYAQRFRLINTVQGSVASLFYRLMIDAYMTPALLANDQTGNYSTSGGSWTVSTSVLTGAMSLPFTSADVGKWVFFCGSDGTYYNGLISACMHAAGVKVIGQNLPISDYGKELRPAPDIASIIMMPLLGTDAVIDLSTLTPAIMRTGEQEKVTLESTVTTAVLPLSLDEFRTFRTSRDANSIAFTLEGEQLRLKKGTGLTSYGALILHYPRVPIDVNMNDDYIDLPDGPAVSIAMELLKARYLTKKKPDPNALRELVSGLYNQFGAMAATEEIKKKVESLT